MEHVLKYITFYVQKHIAPLTLCYYLPVVRDKALGALAFMRLLGSELNIWYSSLYSRNLGPDNELNSRYLYFVRFPTFVVE